MSSEKTPFNPHFTYALSGIVETTGDWHFMRCNQAALAALQWSVPRMKSVPMNKWFDTGHEQNGNEHFSLLRMQGLSHSQLSVVGMDGKVQWLDVSSVQGADDLFIHFINNITHEREQAQALDDALAQAQQAAEAKSAFVATVSHEMRTPLNAVLGLAHLCLQADVPATVRQNLEKIARSGQTLLRLINDVLDFSKVEAQQMAYDREPFDLWEMLEDLAATTAYAEPGKALELAFVLDPDLPRFVLGDRHRLTQVLTNLLGNAVKFTDRGEVSLTLRQGKPQEQTPTLLAEVLDTGIGMSANELAQLFQPFTQVNGTTTRRHGGTGLGLVIAQSMAQGMGGELTVSSAPGSGSKFVLELPLHPVETGASPFGRQNARRHMGVYATSSLTQRALHATVQAIGGAVAPLDEVETDAVLIDLPDSESVQHWAPDGSERTTLLVVHARDAVSLLERLGPGQHSHVVVRPVTPLALLRALDGTRPAPAHAAVTVPSNFSGLHIAVAEDVPINQEVISALLHQAGISVEVASNGAELLKLVADAPMAMDMVLMDLHMPVMDGCMATRALRQRGFRAPIVALTAGSTQEVRATCEQAGMNDFLLKPIDPGELWSTLTRWLPPARVNTPAPPQAPGSDTAIDTSDSGWAALCAACGVDLDEALPRFLNQKPALKKALQSFWQQYRHAGHDMQECLQRNDREGLRQRAHALRGGAATVGAIALRDAAGQLESAAPVASTETCMNALHELSAALKKLSPLSSR